MSEFKRLFGRKTIFMLLAFVIINTGLFMMSFATEKNITLTGSELESHISGYPEFLENTRKNSENLSMLNMYKQGFAADNIEKTAVTYEKLEDITVKSGDNRGIVLFLQYKLSDVILLCFLVVISIGFLKERRKGTVSLVRSTIKGRGILYFQRVGILAVSSVVTEVLLYGSNLLAMLIFFGDADLLRSIQSLPEFMQCHYSITIAEYILISLLLKITACFLCAFAFFILISVFGTGIAFTVSALFAVSEVFLYNLIIPVSSVNSLKYINIFALINCEDFLSVCRNINVFGKAVPALNCNIVAVCILNLILILVGYFVHGKMYVGKKNFLESICEKPNILLEKLSFQRTLLGWEGFKPLIKQGGLTFAAAAFLLALSSVLKYDYIYHINPKEQLWYDEFKGIITEEVLLEAEEEMRLLEGKIELYHNQITDLLSRENYSEDSIDRLYTYLERVTEEKDALSPVYENIRYGFEYTEKTGNTIYLIEPYSYELLTQYDKQTRSRASLFILIGIIGAVSGVFAYDRQNNMLCSQRCTYRGRKKLTMIKIGLVCVVCTVICISIHLIQFVQIGNLLGYNNLNVPIQSLMFMRDFKPYISISEYIILLFAVRAAAACLIGLVCTVISRLSADTTTAMGISLFTLAVPSVFAGIISSESIFSCIYLISGEIVL